MEITLLTYPHRESEILKQIQLQHAKDALFVSLTGWGRKARSFMLKWRKGEGAREQLLIEDPGLYYAYMIYDNIHTDPEVRFMLEARLLSGQPADEIANALKTLPDAVKWYERLFFNVRPFLSHHDWIVKHVLLPSADRFLDADDDDDGSNNCDNANHVHDVDYQESNNELAVMVANFSECWTG